MSVGNALNPRTDAADVEAAQRGTEEPVGQAHLVDLVPDIVVSGPALQSEDHSAFGMRGKNPASEVVIFGRVCTAGML